MTGGAEASQDVPEWLQPVVDAVPSVQAVDLSRILPPRHIETQPASVLMLFGEEGDQPVILLTERSHDMRSHAGQVAFPGGRQDPEDESAVSAALREAEEETGLDPDGVEVFGVLPPLWLPPTNFSVTPVLGWWRVPSPVSAVDPAETASVHLVTIAELLNPDNRVMVRHPSGYIGPGFEVHDLVVWGFTAGVLSRLFAIVGWERAWDQTRHMELPAHLVASSLRDISRGVGGR